MSPRLSLANLPLSIEDQARLRKQLDRQGSVLLASTLCVSRTSVYRGVAGLKMRPSTRRAVQIGLDELDEAAMVYR